MIKTARNLGVIPWDQAVRTLNQVTTIRNRIWSSDFHFNRQLIKLIAKWIGAQSWARQAMKYYELVLEVSLIWYDPFV